MKIELQCGIMVMSALDQPSRISAYIHWLLPSGLAFMNKINLTILQLLNKFCLLWLMESQSNSGKS